MNYLPLLAIFAGVAISLQATLNARLGVLLQNTLLGTGIAFMVGCLLCLALVAVIGKFDMKAASLQTVPVYLWFTGGALGALGVGLLYFLIPQMGVGPMTVFSLAGQLLVATAASHFGWFDLPQNPVTLQNLIGFLALFTGVALVNGDKIYAPGSNLTVVSTTIGVMIPAMWTVRRDNPGPAKTLRLRFYACDECLSYAEFLRALAEDTSFRELIQEELQTAPFVAFRWETPPLTATTIDQPFECLLHDSPDLDVRADPTDFQTYFQPCVEVVSFENLGADALLIVPCPISKSANYSHIGAFHHSAPRSQQHAFWVAVAQTVLARVGPKPLWLSTAGGGVDWLHMRLDERPKYYRHLPWREAEDALPAG